MLIEFLGCIESLSDGGVGAEVTIVEYVENNSRRLGIVTNMLQRCMMVCVTNVVIAEKNSLRLGVVTGMWRRFIVVSNTSVINVENTFQQLAIAINI